MGKNRGKVPEAGWEILRRGWSGWVSLRLGTSEQKHEAIEEAGLRKSVPGGGNSKNKALDSGGNYECVVVDDWTRQNNKLQGWCKVLSSSTKRPQTSLYKFLLLGFPVSFLQVGPSSTSTQCFLARKLAAASFSSVSSEVMWFRKADARTCESGNHGRLVGPRLRIRTVKNLIDLTHGYFLHCEPSQARATWYPISVLSYPASTWHVVLKDK